MKGMEGIPALNFKQTNKPNTELKQWNVTQRIYTPVLSFRIHFPFRPLYCFVIVIRRVVAAVITGRKYNIIVNGIISMDRFGSLFERPASSVCDEAESAE